MTHYKLCFRPKVDTDERDAAVTKPAQTCESDDDDADDDDAEVDVDFVEDSFVETGLKTSSSTDLVGSGSGSGKSPTHSMRSVLSRPRSAPSRRKDQKNLVASNEIKFTWSKAPACTAWNGNPKGFRFSS